MRLFAETSMRARAAVREQIKVLDRRLMALAEVFSTVRFFMTAPGVGAITALSGGSSLV